MSQPTPPARVPVTRERALAEAVLLADSEGIDAVSMRNLAARLKVVPMALYKHVASKDDLLDGMVDAIIASYDEPGESTDWRSSIRDRILAARRALVRHPWARRLIESRTTRTPAVLTYMDEVTGIFLTAGFSPDLTHHAMHALGHRIWGFSPEAFTESSPEPLPSDPAQLQAMMQYMAATYPNILAIAAGASSDDGAIGAQCNEQFEFEFTLDLLLDAFQRLHDAGWSSRGVTPGRPPTE